MLFVSKVYKRNVRRVNVTYDLTILYFCVNRILICSSNKQSLSNKHTTIYVFHSIHLRPRGGCLMFRVCLVFHSIWIIIDLADKPNIIEKNESNEIKSWDKIIIFRSFLLSKIYKINSNTNNNSILHNIHCKYV